MAKQAKSSKAGRQKASGQNLKYKNERRAEQNKLTRLKAHVKRHGVTAEVRETMRRLEIVLGRNPSDLKVDMPQRSAASARFHALGIVAVNHRNQMRRDGSKRPV